MSARVPILHLAPWVDFGGSDKGTIDWFRWLDKARFAPSLITTQPSANRRIAEVVPHAEEVWALPQHMSGQEMPRFILEFIVSRRVRIVHVMNSRLAFELLPDLAALDDPPALVVQLHVEEEDRSGYVRLVTTRYGNLVDAFSVSSRHLGRAVEGYGARANRIEVIPTGVDAAGEFCPDGVVPQPLGPGAHILFPGRLTAQKDPLLMVRVAEEVARRRPDARVHVVGDGELLPAVRDAVARARLESTVAFHPPTSDLAPWYAASDVLLMTSAFEGVPYVLGEAMAMGLPSVVPDLPGNAELLGGGGGVLVAPRGEPGGYADALVSILGGNGEARRLGEAARERVRQSFTVQDMAAAHERLYDRLLAAQAPSSRSDPPTPLPPARRLPTRPGSGAPRVSVVVPCFNHGRWLPQTLDSVREQTYADVEIIVVDDASDDTHTVEVIAALREDPGVTVVEHPGNRGPGAARNTGVARATGRYVLPVDADNLLLPEAIASLVVQLQAAGEQVGFVYPNLQYFGNRHDYFEAPAYDLERLRTASYCDTCSLIDRSVFDAGFAFPEDIDLGHEDWDFVLSLGAEGIFGEAAEDPTLFYRKSGFTRSDSVEYRGTPFVEDLHARHPALYPAEAPGVDLAAAYRQQAALKAIWQPAISVVLLEDVHLGAPEGRDLIDLVSRQTLCDAEVLAPFSEDPRTAGHTPHLRRLPPAHPDRLTGMLAMARANYLVVVQRDAARLFAVPGFFEALVHARRDAGASVGIAFADGGPDHRRLTLDVLDDVAPDAVPIAVALFERFGGPQLPQFATGPGDEEVAAIVAILEADHVVQWRHVAGAGRSPGQLSRPGLHDPAPAAPESERERFERLVRRYSQPAPPARASIRRWDTSKWPAWLPPETAVLIRYREVGGERRVVRLADGPPAGYELEHWLGAVQRFGPPGTARIDVVADPSGLQTAFHAVAPDSPLHRNSGVEALGHVELTAFPLLQSLHVARVRDTGELTLVAGAADDLLGRCDLVGFLGHVEAFPNLPLAPAYRCQPRRQHLTLVRGIAGRRHVYGVDGLNGDRIVARLGRLSPVGTAASIAVHLLADGTLVTGKHRPMSRSAPVAVAARWVAAPLSWRGGPQLPRARATGRRLVQATVARPVTPRAIGELGPPVGYLHATPGPTSIELFSATHPVTGDQLVTPYALEATDMGYGEVTSLGWANGPAEVVHIERYSVPWASRFGLQARKR